ncbi:MAG: hypothetical protein A2V63_05940 [Candidatus Eisenbacteria bacterium RBG_19FT_COMBO_70_11]|nr:MAG: hypothetical protein A2V63_05940 [Candidatus Eisenbacteria bacterium RBG_19FT_COMBO_70_11]
MRIAGAVLVLLGMLALLWGGIPYRKTENVAQFGDFKMQVTEKKEFTIPPVVSGIVILAGAALLFSRRKPGP